MYVYLRANIRAMNFITVSETNLLILSILSSLNFVTA